MQTRLYPPSREGSRSVCIRPRGTGGMAFARAPLRKQTVRGYRGQSEGALASVGHRINDVVHANAYPKRRILFRIVGVVRPFPGISDVGIEGHRDHDTPVIVIDAAPVRS